MGDKGYAPKIAKRGNESGQRNQPCQEKVDQRDQKHGGTTIYAGSRILGNQQLPKQPSYSSADMNAQVQKFSGGTDVFQMMHPRPHRKLCSNSVFFDDQGVVSVKMKYDNGQVETKPLIANAIGPMEVIVLNLAGKYQIYSIVFESGLIIYGDAAELKQKALYDLFVRYGIWFNPILSEAKISTALYKFLAPTIAHPAKTVHISGKPGWEDKQFKVAASMKALNRYHNKMSLPILEKHFDKDAAGCMCSSDYIQFLSQIKDDKNRVLTALLPFAGVIFSLLLKNQKNLPPVVNFVITDPEVEVHSLAQYLQVFNRDDGIQTYNLESSGKIIDSACADAKDEVLMFTGMTEEDMTYYANKVVSKNLNHIAKRGLGRYGNKPLEALVTLFSNQLLLMKGVRNVYVDRFFFKDGETAGSSKNSLVPMLAAYINWIETYYKEVELRMDRDYPSGQRTEHFWSVVLSVVGAFWEVLGKSLEEVLGLPENFTFEFLWQEQEYELENASEVVVDIVRRAMNQVYAYELKISTELMPFMYDEDYLLLLPEVFSDILATTAVREAKDVLLIKCKEDGILKCSPYGGFTTRVQKNGIRKEYYKFVREAFNKPGLPEIIDLAGGEVYVN